MYQVLHQDVPTESAIAIVKVETRLTWHKRLCVGLIRLSSFPGILYLPPLVLGVFPSSMYARRDTYR
jgi:hypothetical protein